MANFKVNTDRLTDEATALSGLSGELGLICQRLIRLELSSTLRTGATSALTVRLNDCGSAVGEQSRNLEALSAGLSEIAQLYRRTETRLAEPRTQSEAVAGSVAEAVRDFFDYWFTQPGPFNLLQVTVGAVLGVIGGNGGQSSGALSGSLIAGSVAASGSWLGVGASGEAHYNVLGYELDSIGEANWNLSEGNAGIRYGGSASGYLAQGGVSGNYGLLGGEAEVSVGNATVSGNVGFTLYEDGVFSPSLGAEVEASVSAVHGEVEGYIGSENNNVHASAEGDLLTASASAGAHAGVITREDPVTGQVTTSYGVSAEVEAEAYLAEGSVSGGFSFFGIEVNGTVTGKIGGAGVTAGGSATTDGVSGNLGLGFLGGGEVEISIDWSDMDLPTWDDVEDGWNDFTSSVSDWFSW